MDRVRDDMTEFWREHSQVATVEEMMLDSHANELTQEELPEILSLLPSLEGCKVLELGAGIGRFTSHLVTKAEHVTAVDFMETFVKKNREINGHHSNVTFVQEDVTKLDLPKSSIDLIFSNWLLMYLSDTEVKSLAENMLSWLQPGGILFFRESCNHHSGDYKRNFNPTCYRSEAEYNHLISLSEQVDDKPEGQKYGFDIILKRKVHTYIKVKNNPNQVCWMLQKVARSSDSQKEFITFQQFLDNKQYTSQGILRYEKIFGHGYVSTGGHTTTKEFVDLLNLKPGQKVLDVGCGIGGGDFYMAKTFGVEVHGLDLSENMIDIALERARTENLSSVHFELADVTKRTFQAGSFDVIYSRDTILHIADKLNVFKRFHSWLKPGGQLLISDYCCGEKPWMPQFEAYVKQRSYILHTPSEYGEIIREAGFSNIQAEDRTSQFIRVIQTELQRCETIKSNFIEEFSEEDYSAIVNSWGAKLKHSSNGDHRWGLFHARRTE